LDPDWRLVAACAVHCAVLVTLLAWALIDHNGHPLPSRLVAITTALALAAAAWLPGVQPVAAGFGPAVGLPARAIASAAGIGAGWCIGPMIGGPAARWMLMLIGAAFGWQAVVAIAALAIACGGLRRLLSAAWPAAHFEHACSYDIVVAAMVHQLAWRMIHQMGGWWHAV
jgi:MFS family permease